MALSAGGNMPRIQIDSRKNPYPLLIVNAVIRQHYMAGFEDFKLHLQPYRISGGHYRLVNHAYCIAGQIGKAS